MVRLAELTEYLDGYLRTAEIPDYPPALNGLQVANRGEVSRIAAAVDVSRRTIDGAVAAGADLLLVHHGAFWSGLQPIRGAFYQRIRSLLENDVAIYASHLPLDLHPELGNNALLAAELGLTPGGTFARHMGVDVGVRGSADVATADLVAKADAFARGHGGGALATPVADDRRTHRWAICTGAGASADTLREAAAGGIDTLIVGEGPHWTAVEAEETGLVIIYAGHYATETLGVAALARHAGERFDLPWSFVAAPTGL